MLAIVVAVTGNVRRPKHGCPDPIPARHSCLDLKAETFLVDNRVFLWFALTLVVLLVVVFVLIPRRFGTSPGKLLMDIRVVRPDGTPPGWRRNLVRSVCWGVDAFLLLLPVALWLAVITPGHRRLGDWVADTRVVRRAQVGRPVPPGQWVWRQVDDRIRHRS